MQRSKSGRLLSVCDPIYFSSHVFLANCAKSSEVDKFWRNAELALYVSSSSSAGQDKDE